MRFPKFPYFITCERDIYFYLFIRLIRGFIVLSFMNVVFSAIEGHRANLELPCVKTFLTRHAHCDQDTLRRCMSDTYV